MTDYSPMFYWLHEREAIRVKKEAGEPFPWTEDAILKAYRFCNVRREDDTVTVWIRENIREPYKDHLHLWLMLCIARAINWPPTLEHLISTGAWPARNGLDFSSYMKAEMDAIEGKVYTGAYIISASSNGISKNEYVSQTIIGDLWRRRETFNPTTLEDTHRWLMRSIGWGQFMAYQAVVDMRFCPSLLASAPDVSVWAAAGPGTIRGLNRLHDRPLKQSISQRQALDEMAKIDSVIWMETGIKVDFSDIPNILCETDKYLRVKNGEGKPRANYVPGRGA